MKLDKKKKLAGKTLGVGMKRIQFDINRLNEIKEAITRQDIRELHASGAIMLKSHSGRKKNIKRKRRRIGKVKIKVNDRKQKYVKITRKLRGYIKSLKDQGKIDKEQYKELRKKIKNNEFKSKRHLKENLE